MDEHGIIEATFRNRYLGALWSSFGIEVIPTIRWTSPEYYDICFEGIEKGSIASISTLGVHSNEKCTHLFLEGYDEMRKRIHLSSIICLGDKVRHMNTDNVLFVPYKDSFENQYEKGWQTCLFNINDCTKGGF